MIRRVLLSTLEVMKLSFYSPCIDTRALHLEARESISPSREGGDEFVERKPEEDSADWPPSIFLPPRSAIPLLETKSKISRNSNYISPNSAKQSGNGRHRPPSSILSKRPLARERAIKHFYALRLHVRAAKPAGFSGRCLLSGKSFAVYAKTEGNYADVERTLG